MISTRMGDRFPIAWRIRGTDLNGCTVSLTLIPRKQPTRPIPDLPLEVTDPDNGVVVHHLDGSLKPDVYAVRIKITRNLDEVTAPSAGEELLLVSD